MWFDTDGEEAATLYTNIFENSRILQVTRYGSAGPRPEGMVMTVNFELDGQEFIALHGGPEFTFDEAILFQVNCESQEEIDQFWARFSDGGEEGPCGWLKDNFGVCWQIVPTLLDEMIRDPDVEKAQRVMKVMLGMGKIDFAELQRAADQAEDQAHPEGSARAPVQSLPAHKPGDMSSPASDQPRSHGRARQATTAPRPGA